LFLRNVLGQLLGGALARPKAAPQGHAPPDDIPPQAIQGKAQIPDRLQKGLHRPIVKKRHPEREERPGLVSSPEGGPSIGVLPRLQGHHPAQGKGLGLAFAVPKGLQGRGHQSARKHGHQLISVGEGQLPLLQAFTEDQRGKHAVTPFL